jgi:PBP1b-binding outer membrane lipoprotein LpoB
MKKVSVAALAALFLTSCVQTQSYDASYRGPEPIPGSITYGGQPRTKLKKAPVGSTLNNSFYGPYGERIEETYIVMPDRSLKLVSRRRGFIGFPYD